VTVTREKGEPAIFERGAVETERELREMLVGLCIDRFATMAERVQEGKRECAA
jgi:hypothetical protein